MVFGSFVIKIMIFCLWLLGILFKFVQKLVGSVGIPFIFISRILLEKFVIINAY